jgi:hypothetical protein
MNTTTEIKRATLTPAAAVKLRCCHTNRCHQPVVVVLSYQFAEGARLNHYPLCETHQAEYSRDARSLRVVRGVPR